MDILTPLFYSTVMGNFGVILYLIKKGADVNKRCCEGKAFPLIYAARFLDGIYDLEAFELYLSS